MELYWQKRSQVVSKDSLDTKSSTIEINTQDPDFDADWLH